MNRLATPVVLVLTLALGCSASEREPARAAPAHALEGEARAHASAEFWTRWGDGRAELSTYRGTVMRYGAARDAELVAIVVTEPLSRRTLVKDDAAPEGERVQVLKLNTMLRFQTGIYPYAVMTSTFMPVDAYFMERFQPAKITLTAQEWCGHVFLGAWPDTSGFSLEGFSYFAEDGERSQRVETSPETLYEDALLVQLRELDGAFHGGADFSGSVVPSLWSSRRDHVALGPRPATITRAAGASETRFVLAYEGGASTTYTIEESPERRVTSIESSTGERFELVATERLAYWELNAPGEESARPSIGLPENAYPAPSPSRAPEPSPSPGS